MANPPEVTNMALFCDFENIALGVRDASYDKFDIGKVLERLRSGDEARGRHDRALSVNQKTGARYRAGVDANNRWANLRDQPAQGGLDLVKTAWCGRGRGRHAAAGSRGKMGGCHGILR